MDNWHMHSVGSGPPLVLLHGWGHSHQSLLPLAKLLSSSHQVLLFDLPGFGASAPPPSVWGACDYAASLHERLQTLRVRRPTIVGHSFGGKVAMHYAARYPQDIDGLILIASAGLRQKRSLGQWLRGKVLSVPRRSIKWYDSMTGGDLFERWFVARYGSPDYRGASGIMRKVLTRSVNEPCEQLVQTIGAPTLIIWGGRDCETAPAMAQRLHSLLPHSELVMLPQHGHQPCDGGGAHLVARHMLRFLRTQAVPSTNEGVKAIYGY